MERESLRVRVPFDVLDLSTTAEFARWTRSEIGPPDALGAGPDIVLDLTDVELLMAAGVRTLVELDDALTANGRSLRVAEPAPIVARVLTICGMCERWTGR